MPRHHLIGAWSGFLFVLLLFIGFWPLANFLPPHAPSASAADIASIYQNNANMIRAGMMFMFIGTGFYLAWTVTATELVRRMVGDNHFCVNGTLIGGAAASMFFFLPSLFWAIASFRPDRSPELTQMLNDIGWLLIVPTVTPFMVQSLAFGVAVLSTKAAQPLLPRWVGFLAIWVAVLLFPAVLTFFFKTGPFAWNGIISFWLPLVVFCPWLMVVSTYTFKAIKHGE